MAEDRMWCGRRLTDDQRRAKVARAARLLIDAYGWPTLQYELVNASKAIARAGQAQLARFKEVQEARRAREEKPETFVEQYPVCAPIPISTPNGLAIWTELGTVLQGAIDDMGRKRRAAKVAIPTRAAP